MTALRSTNRPKLFRQVYLASLSVALLSLLAVSFYALRSGAEARRNQLQLDMRSHLEFVMEDVGVAALTQSPAQVDAYCKRLGEKTGIRITIMLPDGAVVGDSVADPHQMDLHANRPEFKQAVAEGVGVSQRYSRTLQRDMLYVAKPMLESGGLVAVVRVALPLLGIRQELADNRSSMIAVALLIGLLATVVSAWISRRVTRPLHVARQGVQRFEQGDFSHRLGVPNQQEVAELVMQLNRMAETLEQRMQTIREQGAEESAILTGMVEGVLAVGPDDRLLKVNESAARLLSIDPQEVEGKPVQEMLRHADLLSYIGRLREGTVQERCDVLLQGAEERIMEVNGSMLSGEDGAGGGVIIVLHDVTRLRRLQRVRSEFVANVSHELKSPITSILGFAETLKDGAVNEPNEARRFLDIIERQAKRMYNIIEDLLRLSRIEDSSARGEVARELTAIRPTLDAAIQQCAERAAEKDIRLECTCDPAVEVEVNPPLLEQALVNLIDNAIKYSGAGSTVSVTAANENGELAIEVSDQGQGIPQEHVPRLFERFYRVDKARSREVGGTGLGLAIVKHIVQAHGGAVSATSTFGKGSTFTVRIPSA